MSKIEQLIQQYCPDGVEWVKLGDIGKVCMCKRILKEQTSSSGDVPFFKIGTFGSCCADSFISQELFDSYKAKYPYPQKGDVLISAAGTIGRTVVFDGNPSYFQDSNIVWLKHDESRVLNSFLWYCYTLNPWTISTGGTIARLYNENILNAVIPLPPLPVQEEIVRILDTFSELQMELQTELQARQQQYQFYRDKLLSFEGRNDVEWKKLGEVCNIKARIGWQRLNKSEYLVKGDFYLVTGVDIIGARVNFQSCYYVSKERYDMDTNIQLKNGDVILTKDGTIGKVALIENMDKPAVLNSHLFVLRDITGHILSKFLMYILLSRHFQAFVEKNKTQGTIPGLNQATIVNFKIPIPSLSEQQRIISILDRFDTLVNDLSQGLPAEIEARKQQYEYYRDKLLTFKRK